MFLFVLSALTVNSQLQLVPAHDDGDDDDDIYADSSSFFPLLQGHVYSLGSTLSAALNFVIEPELEADLGEEIQKLLEQMQEETPEDRPLLQVQHHYLLLA